jgi:asparagine synthase (glutamine-hydrolysing)
MCGISAVFAYHPDAPPVDRDEVEAITQRMYPRGPDAGGTWFSDDGRAGLGSRRLAIIDLSPDGVQPMTDVSGQFVIVFNGELYNHRELRKRLERNGARFRSHSDTEVLLEMYKHDGPAMVDLLRGMYAFVILDKRDGRLFMARDPYGIKPLYIADDGRTVRIASQVKALLAGGRISRTPDPAGVAGFFVTGSVPEPFTTYASIRAVEAGNCFFIDANGPSAPRCHYSIADIYQRARAQEPLASLVEPATLLGEFVQESLAYHLVSDVPVGAFLSAGIDSTTLVALMTNARHEPPQTITLSFEEFRGREQDESLLAARFASELGAPHTTRIVTREEFLADMPRFFDQMDQPTIDGTNTWFVSKAAAEQRLKVAISGLGGDELFGSYPSFRELPRIVRLARVPLATRLLRNPKAKSIARYGRTLAGAYLVKRGLFMPEELPLVLGDDVAHEGLERLNIVERIRSVLDVDPGTDFGRIATLESALYMRNQLLRDTDWASMAHSLEVRTPLVDAFLLRQLAPLLVVGRSKSKDHFAASARPPLPDYLRNRRKTGFSVPLKEWLNLPPDGTTTRMRSWARHVFERVGS